MKESYLILDFSAWYYTRAFKDMLVVWSNLMWFVVHFFSIPLLVRTLFSPWKRMTDPYHPKSVEDFFGTLAMNMVSRLLGALVRTVIIVCGVLLLLLGVAGLFLIIVLWILMPLVFVVSVGYGIMLLAV